jgi:hypothetical protein
VLWAQVGVWFLKGEESKRELKKKKRKTKTTEREE